MTHTVPRVVPIAACSRTRGFSKAETDSSPTLHSRFPQVDYDPRAAYFRQMKYGLYVRMALLAITLHKA